MGLTLVRKPGKLPYEKVGVSYELEYGSDRVEMHVDGIDGDDRAVLVDDLLATGGTAAAAAELVEKVGGRCVEALFLIELEFLAGRSRLGDLEIHSLVKF